MRASAFVLASGWLSLIACGGDGSTDPGPTDPGPTVLVAIQPGSIPSGGTVQATATIDGSPAPNVTWSSSNPAVASVNGTGLITGTRAGSAAITARSGEVTGSANVTVIPGAPVTLIIWAGDGQSGPVGSLLFDPLCTIVHDAAGNRIIGIAVTYSVGTGGGTLAQPTAPTTGVDGIAISGLWRLGASPGQQTVVASVPGVTPVTFKATAQ